MIFSCFAALTEQVVGITKLVGRRRKVAPPSDRDQTPRVKSRYRRLRIGVTSHRVSRHAGVGDFRIASDVSAAGDGIAGIP